ncbi:MAG: substrate-binding domain-containing protein [Acidimicrobiales bacterium]
MMTKHLGRKLGVALAALGLFSTMAVTMAGATASLNGDLTFASADGAASINPAMGGSSFDEPFFNSAIPIYMTDAAKVSGANAPSSIALYTPVGSTAGKKGVVAGTYAVGATDVPMGTVVNGTNLDSSILTNADPAHTLSSYQQVPVVLGGVGMMYNLPGLTKFKAYPVILNAAAIAGMYDGQITNWNDPSICALNPKIVNVTYKFLKKKGKFVLKHGKKVKVVASSKCAMPNVPVVPVYRADGSGTTFITMDYLNQTEGASFKTPAGAEVYPGTTFQVGEVPSTGLGAQKNAGVAADVEQTAGAIGYVEYSYILLQHTLPAARLINSAGKVVSINEASIAADAAAFASSPPKESVNGVVSSFSIVNGAGATSYPIAGYSWAVVRQDWNGLGTVGGTSASLNSEKLVAKFLDWCVEGGSDGGQNVAKLQGYVPLPSYVVAVAQAQVSAMTYNGTSLGLS